MTTPWPADLLRSSPPMTLPTASAPRGEAVAACLLGGDGAVLGAEDADRPFYAASTIKLHVLMAVLRGADRGDLDLAGEVAATRTVMGPDGRPVTLAGDHLDPSHPAECTPIPVGELAVRMIDRSSNEATNHLVALLGDGDARAGLAVVGEEIARLGLTATRMERLIGDAPAIARGETNEVSAADLARTAHVLSRGDDLSLTSRELARRALAAQRIRLIAAVLRAGVPVGSKSGTVPGYRHDVAVIGSPGTTVQRVLAVLTAGGTEQQATGRIHATARRLLPELTTPAG